MEYLKKKEFFIYYLMEFGLKITAYSFKEL